MSNVDYKRLLPKKMRDTRWGEFIEVFQEEIEQINSEKIRPIFDQFDLEKATKQELIDYCNYYGYDVLNLEGLTSTREYLKKQVLSVIPKIIYKTTYKVFPYVGLPYGLTTTGHNTIYNFGNNTIITLESIEEAQDYISDPVTTLDWGSPNIVYYLDLYTLDYIDPLTGETDFTLDDFPISTLNEQNPVYIDPNPNPNMDTTLDDPLIPILDMELALSMISRIFVISYKPNFVENSFEFLSEDSMKSLASDTEKIKRATDFVYYESHVPIRLNSDKSVTTKTWKNFEGVETANQESILISNDLSQLGSIRLGNSSHNVLHSGITDVKSFTQEFQYSGCVWHNQTESYLYGRPLIKENQHFDPITEIALMDVNSGCMAYSKFPKISWREDLNANIKFDIQLI